MIDSCKKKSEKVAAYTEQSTANFEKITNITVNNDNLIPQKNKMGVSKIIRKIVKFLTEKMSQIRVLKKSRKIIEQNVSKTFGKSEQHIPNLTQQYTIRNNTNSHSS